MNGMRVLGCVFGGAKWLLHRRQPGQSTPMNPAASCRIPRSPCVMCPLTMRHGQERCEHWGEFRCMQPNAAGDATPKQLRISGFRYLIACLWSYPRSLDRSKEPFPMFTPGCGAVFRQLSGFLFDGSTS